MAGAPKPTLSPYQRAAGVLGQTNAEWLFSNHNNPQALSTVGDDAWGTVLEQTRKRVAANQPPPAPTTPPTTPPAPTPAPTPPPTPTPAPPPPQPAQPAVVPNRPETPTPESGGTPAPRRTGKGQLRTDPFAQAASTGLQLPR